MSQRKDLQSAPRETLFHAMQETRIALLSIEGNPLHPQPMTHFLDPATAEIWYLAARDSRLVRAVGLGARAQLAFTDADHLLHAGLSGAIVQSTDEARIDAIWTPAAAAWFPGGRQDPNLVALRLTLESASVWASTSSGMRVGIEMLRGAITRHAPEIGTHVELEFNG